MRSSNDTAHAANISYRQLDHWTRRGVVQPTIAAQGSGSQRLFDAGEVFVIAVLAELHALGCPLDVCAYVGDVFRCTLPRGGVVYVDRAGDVSRELTPGGAWVLDLDTIEEQLDDANDRVASRA